MRRIFMSGGNMGGSLNVRARLLLSFFVIAGILLLAFFAFAALAFAVVLVPVGIVLYAVRKIFLTGRNSRKTEEAPEVNTQEIKDIIDITEYEEAEEIKTLKGGNKDGL